MRRRVPIAILGALLLLSTTVPALTSRQQNPTFRAGVEVVLIDVNVVDKSHAPVADLKAEDFIVSVDRKPRTITSAQFIRYDVRSAIVTEKNRVVVPVETIRATPVAAPAPDRNVLVVVDTDSMEPGDGLRLREEAAKFIDHLAPNDRIGVVTIPHMASDITLTKDREQVRSALATIITGSERYRPVKFRIGLWEAFGAERDEDAMVRVQTRECGTQPKVVGRGVLFGGCYDEVRDEVKHVVLQERLRGERSLRALRTLGTALTTVGGPKTMLIVSGGTAPPDDPSWYSLVGNSFAAAQITVYTLWLEQPGLGQVKYKESTTPGQDYIVEREGLENATSAVGGTFMEGIGTWDQYFDRIVAELSGSYLLGVEVHAADRDGRPHQVSVKVNRKGVDVRARKAYVIEAKTPAAIR